VTEAPVDIIGTETGQNPVAQGFAHYPHSFPHRYVNKVPGKKVPPRPPRPGERGRRAAV